MAEIVVGVDGSPGSEAALRWTLEEAALRDAHVHVVHAFEPATPALDVTMIGPPGTFADVPAGELERLSRSAESAARAGVEQVLARVGVARSGVQVRTSLVEGDAAAVLVEAAADAALLVVGSRGHGAVRELLLGSVSHTCARTAPCAVVVLPPPAAA